MGAGGVPLQGWGSGACWFVVSAPCNWASPGSTGVGHRGVGERRKAAEKELNPLLFLLPVSKRGTSLGWGAGCLGLWGGEWAARDLANGCVCPGGENNTLDCRRKGRECEDGNFTHPGLGHKPQYKNNLRLDVWALSGPVRTGSPTPSWPQAHISHGTPHYFS